jgi:AraC family transcriptional regulator
VKLERLTRRLIHLRQVANYIDIHLDSHLAASLTLDDLADVARLSRFHFERVFADYAGETPLVRVRRLRLARARRLIEEGRVTSLLDLALDSGYASAEAFSRAFRAQFGCAPSSLSRQPDQGTPPIRIEALPALGIQYIPFEGRREDAMQAFDELRARALMQNIPRERRKGWRVDLSSKTSDGTVKLQAALLSERLGTHITGLQHGVLPAGDYAVIELQGGYEPPALPELAQRIMAETGWQIGDGPVLQSFHNAAYLPARQEKRCDLYVPVQR